MIDLPISHAHSVSDAGKIATVFARLIALFQIATAEHVQRRVMRRAPEEILAAQARREEARRAVDRLLQRR